MTSGKERTRTSLAQGGDILRRIIVAVLSDTHGGSKRGLCSPDVKLQDDDRGEYTPTLRAGQQWFWPHYIGFKDRIAEIAGRSEIHVLHTGDICQGTRFADDPMSMRMADHLAIAAANMAPWLALPRCKSLTLVTGTGAHDFGEGSAEEAVSQYIGSKQVRLAWHDLIDIDGLLIDVAHHGPHPGTRSWTEGSVARFYLRSCLYKEHPPADVYLRGHYHEMVRVPLWHEHKMHNLLISPAWQWPGPHSIQVTQSRASISCGMWALEIVGGRLVEIHELWEEKDLRRRVKL